ncbi:cation:proton antiporter [Pseudorhodoferax sp.]|uniref:cation:proton antiporter n=1 Tax=Pseudorhodoferax sp. TaxID=1993553 RepID=UPI002DD653F5|nr:cation:proton antiporter [Pseudorhodoferax sp.]
MTVLLLLLQLAVVLVAARICGLLLRALGQPMVIGEMAAGILLGPIVFGALAPQLHAQLFPSSSLPALSALSTLGVVLFMGLVGAELRAPGGMGAQLRASLWVGLSSMALPMLLGLAIAPVLYPALAPAGLAFWPFALFVAVALSITAFPVLARILKDRNMSRTPVGQLALGSAAVVDACAWIVLALVLAVGSAQGAGAGGWSDFLRICGGLALFSAALLLLLKPLYAALLRRQLQGGRLSDLGLAAVLIGLIACAAVAEWLQLHAVFGAFLFGVCLPRDDALLHALEERLAPLATVLLLPVFFALAGLGASADALSAAALPTLALVLAAAIVGKVAGGAAGARLAGWGWRDSLAAGTLMNARGLMELIVIKIGLDAGLITPTLFTMLLLMALATTALTGPLLNLLGIHPPVAILSARRRVAAGPAPSPLPPTDP